MRSAFRPMTRSKLFFRSNTTKESDDGFLCKERTAISPVEKPPEGGLPPLVIWGPGDPRPRCRSPDNPGTGVTAGTGARQPIPALRGAGRQFPNYPIAEPPWGWGNPPPDNRKCRRRKAVKYGWTEATGWFVLRADRPGADAVEGEVTQWRPPELLISFLYLLLNIAIILLVAALIVWVLRWLGIGIDPMVYKIGQAIVALLIIIAVVVWVSGVAGWHAYRWPLLNP